MQGANLPAKLEKHANTVILRLQYKKGPLGEPLDTYFYVRPTVLGD